MIYKPPLVEYEGFFERYVNLVPDEDLLHLLDKQAYTLPGLLGNLPEERAHYAYAEGKWSLKQVVGHLADTERILSYRALCFSRQEQQPLPGFDENAYVEQANFQDRPLADLLQDCQVVRQASLSLFRGMGEEMLTRTGTANRNKLSVRALGFIIAGHELHHVAILRSRYKVV
jgi:hypothetical protein